eukprot:gene6452-3084_t
MGSRKNNPQWDVSSLVEDQCVHCKKDDWQPGLGPRTLIGCSCCESGYTHVSCFEENTGQPSKDILDPGSKWYCSEAVKYLNSIAGDRHPLPTQADYTWEVLKYVEGDKVSTKSIGQATSILKSAFTLEALDDGRELLDLVCTSYVTPTNRAQTKADGGQVENEDEEEEELDYSNFRILALRKKGVMVSTATLRVFGNKFAELPFVATKDGHRRQGHCRRLMQAAETLLSKLEVRSLVLPSVKKVLSMWKTKFGFEEISEKEHDVLERFVVNVDLSTSVLMKKQVGVSCAPDKVSQKRGQSQTQTQKRVQGQTQNKNKKRPGQKQSRLPETHPRESSSSDESSDSSKGWSQDGSSSESEDEYLKPGRCLTKGPKPSNVLERRGIPVDTSTQGKYKLKEELGMDGSQPATGAGDGTQTTAVPTKRKAPTPKPIKAPSNQGTTSQEEPGTGSQLKASLKRPSLPPKQPPVKRQRASTPKSAATTSKQPTKKAATGAKASATQQNADAKEQDRVRKLRLKMARKAYRQERRDYVLGMAMAGKSKRLKEEVHNLRLQLQCQTVKADEPASDAIDVPWESQISTPKGLKRTDSRDEDFSAHTPTITKESFLRYIMESTQPRSTLGIDDPPSGDAALGALLVPEPQNSILDQNGGRNKLDQDAPSCCPLQADARSIKQMPNVSQPITGISAQASLPPPSTPVPKQRFEEDLGPQSNTSLRTEKESIQEEQMVPRDDLMLATQTPASAGDSTLQVLEAALSLSTAAPMLATCSQPSPGDSAVQVLEVAEHSFAAPMLATCSRPSPGDSTVQVLEAAEQSFAATLTAQPQASPRSSIEEKTGGLNGLMVDPESLTPMRQDIALGRGREQSLEHVWCQIIVTGDGAEADSNAHLHLDVTPREECHEDESVPLRSPEHQFASPKSVARFEQECLSALLPLMTWPLFKDGSPPSAKGMIAGSMAREAERHTSPEASDNEHEFDFFDELKGWESDRLSYGVGGKGRSPPAAAVAGKRQCGKWLPIHRKGTIGTIMACTLAKPLVKPPRFPLKRCTPHRYSKARPCGSSINRFSHEHQPAPECFVTDLGTLLTADGVSERRQVDVEAEAESTVEASDTEAQSPSQEDIEAAISILPKFYL